MMNLKKISNISLGLFFLGLTTNATAGGKISEVQCTGNPTDRALVQSYVDNAKKDETIKLIGVCQFDGISVDINKSHITITGAGADDNWSTEVRGLTDENGQTINNDSGAPYTIRNVAFNFGDKSGASIVKNIEISHIKFKNFAWTITLYPQLFRGADEEQPDGNFGCEDLDISKNGSAKYIRISHNMFTDSSRAVTAYGNLDFVSIDNNITTGTSFLVAAGGGFGCFNADGENISVTSGTPRFMSIRNNHTTGAFFGVSFNIMKQSIVANNTLSNNFAAGLLLENVSNIVARNNIIDGAQVGIVGTSNKTGLGDNLLSKNSISGTSFTGILIDVNTSDYLMVNNDFLNTGVADIFLDAGSNHNTVIALTSENTIFDLGEDNLFFGHIMLLNN